MNNLWRDGMAYLTYGEVAKIARRKGLIMAYCQAQGLQRLVSLRWRNDPPPPGCPRHFPKQPLAEAFATIKGLPEIAQAA